MTLKRKFIYISLFLLLFTVPSLNPTPALALGSPDSVPSFAEFWRSVQNGQKDVLRGVYVDHVLALPIVQQPKGKDWYVSGNDGEATQFGIASNFGNIGLLAHNNLAGKSFLQLKVGKEVSLIYGDGHIEMFAIKEILRYQALQPNSPFSSFKNLNKDETLNTGQMFKRVYSGNYHLTFQTCIYADGNSSWGRLFVIATPADEHGR